MKYISTRNKSVDVQGHEAILQGLAPDGGLYVPERFPVLSSKDINSLCGMDYEKRATHIISLFLEEFSHDEITGFASAAYGEPKFPSTGGSGATSVPLTRQAPVVRMGTDYFLELWHGPTCAFKDMALQMLPQLLKASLNKAEADHDVIILTATSGDTGKAALEGFSDADRTKIMVFYPADGVSEIQALQMNTQVGSNVHVQAVRGNFDDTQTAVKSIFSDRELNSQLESSGWRLSSANSINWGRLLPQIVYYVSAYCDLVSSGEIEQGSPVNFCVPTGNFGNILAAYYASKMGIPINKLICASNENNILTDFIRTGRYDINREFFCTISPSMDILISSNLERLLFDIVGADDAVLRKYMRELTDDGAYSVDDDIFDRIRQIIWADYSTGEETKAAIRHVWDEHDYLIDPHTAVAYDVYQKYRQTTGDTTKTVIVSTANPYKFCEAVLDAIGESPSLSNGKSYSGLELVDLLHEKTGVPAPDSISALKAAEIRFSGIIYKCDMADCVKDFSKV